MFKTLKRRKCFGIRTKTYFGSVVSDIFAKNTFEGTFAEGIMKNGFPFPQSFPVFFSFHVSFRLFFSFSNQLIVVSLFPVPFIDLKVSAKIIPSIFQLLPSSYFKMLILVPLKFRPRFPCPSFNFRSFFGFPIKFSGGFQGFSYMIDSSNFAYI